MRRKIGVVILIGLGCFDADATSLMIADRIVCAKSELNMRAELIKYEPGSSIFMLSATHLTGAVGFGENADQATSQGVSCREAGTDQNSEMICTTNSSEDSEYAVVVKQNDTIYTASLTQLFYKKRTKIVTESRPAGPTMICTIR